MGADPEYRTQLENVMSEEKIKHLEFVQNVVTRMNANSFQIKGWTVTIVSALIAVYASTQNSSFILIGIFPTFIFWFLDAYYLNQERKFRGLYSDIAGNSESEKSIKPFEMRPDLYVGGKYSYWRSFLSRTISIMYLSISTSLIFLFLYLEDFLPWINEFKKILINFIKFGM